MKIREVINKIDERHLFIPAFQREYVWKRPDAKNLISSLIKDYPTGTMLTWETTNPPELKGDYAYESNKGAVKLILDGQQRITTLYLLITGEIPPYYREDEILNDIRGLYVNVETLVLEYYKKTIMENDPLWVNITDIFKDNINVFDILERLESKEDNAEITKDRQKIIYNNIYSINQIKDREFVEQVIPAKANIKEAIDIFYIVNASGVNLTDAELALAQISGYWPQAREEFKEKLEELKSTGWVFSLDFIVFTLLAVTHHQGSKMSKLHSADNKEVIQHAWQILRDRVLDYTCNTLQSHAYVDHTHEINSVYALIPIITHVYHQPGNKLSENEINKVIKWFYYSQIRFRYISQLRHKLDKDIGVVVNSSNPFDELLNLINEEKALEIKPSEFKGRGISHPLFSLMRWYFKSNNAICLSKGVKLRKNMGEKYSLERDHIFAYARLKNTVDKNGKLYYDMDDKFDYSLAQEMTNRCILSQAGNREKSDMDAKAFLENVQQEYPSALKLQCIPENKELWEIENFKEFLQKRREILADELNNYLNNISITEDVKSEIPIEELIESGEHSFLEFKSTMRWNVRETKPDKKMEEIIIKTISAFSNAQGGRLLIGVADNGEILGLQDDYNSLREANKDYFEIHLNNLINSAFGKNFAPGTIRVHFPIINEEEICVIDIEAGNKPLYIDVTSKDGLKQRKFFVRSGNSSQDLDIDEAASYIQNRFTEN
jgi:uncharacterized protein with ParB-like and HNH nuclease domain